MKRFLCLTIPVLILCIVCQITAMSLEQFVKEQYNNESISSDSLYTVFKNYTDFEQPEELAILIKDYHTINDTLQAPFVYYLPSGYRADKKTPLLIYLHGGVSRPEFIEDYYDNLHHSPFLKIANEKNWILLFPMANIQTAWWSEKGIENIMYQIRFLKERFNVDDNRIYLSGFSDGASGSFHLGMTTPNDFAAFYPLNGNMLVGTIVTGYPTYTTNLRNRYHRVINTDLDFLYPADKMRLLIKTAQDMGANIFYLEYWGIGHTYDYAEYDLPLMIEDMEKQVRNIFQPSLYWETTDPRWGRCDWLEILEIDTLSAAQDWHCHNTVLLPDDRVTFGFYDDNDFTGYGVRISNIVDNSVSEEIGLISGDVIISMDGIETETINDLLNIRNDKKRGDEFHLTIIRDQEEIILEGAFPPVTYHEHFNYQQKSGALKALYRGNVFHIESSRVAKLAVYIHPGMVNLDIPIRIFVNEREIFNDFIEIDREFMTVNFLNNKDRSVLWIKKLVLKIP
ncbi:MAG: PDZ domain-containing protein [Candidatus Cloacimonetes bacterium]|nr:PDZ domain-containing protein [Candidatus Cloacimonadota bacterium]